jgi:hypothetical protein
MQQISLFTGGAITNHIGAFIQGTYDGVGLCLGQYRYSLCRFGEDRRPHAALGHRPQQQPDGAACCA